MSHLRCSTILTAFSSDLAFQAEEEPTVALGGLGDPFSDALSELARLDLGRAALAPPSRSLDDVGGLDANMLFADLPMTSAPAAPEAAAALASLISPPRAISARPSQVTTVRAHRGDRASSHVRSARAPSARTLGYIACGAMALLATFAACVFYVQRPIPQLHATAHVGR